MDATQQALLKRHLADVYVWNLPPLLQPSQDVTQNDQKNLARSISAFVVHHYCGASVADACASVVDDFGDLGIDAIFYQADIKTLFLIQSKLKASEQFTQDEANAFCQGIRKLIASDYTGFNQNVLDRQVQIDAALDDCERIQLVVAHTGDQLRQYPAQAIADLIADPAHGEERLVDPVLDFSVSDIMTAFREVNAHTRIDCRLTLFDWAKVSGNRTAYIGMVKLEQLAQLHIQHDKALYARNIRASLGHRTDVNRSIDNSLANNAADFEFFNNGVTALCNSIQGRQGNRDSKSFQIGKLSIVNGAQTVATAARRVGTAGAASISDARVLVTIIAADAENDFGQSVTRARNHQNDVGKADFVALDAEQERIRRELGLVGYRYAYQAEALDLTDPTIIRVEEAAFALSMLLPDPRLPVMAKRNAASMQKVGQYPYSTIFTPALSALELRNAVIAFRYIITRMNEQAAGAPTDQERLAYRHSAYSVAFVMMKQLRGQIGGQPPLSLPRLAAAVGPELDNLRQVMWAQMQPISVGRNPLSVFKTQADVSGIIRAAMVEHYGLQSNSALQPLIALNIGDQPYPERLFAYLSNQAPQIGNLI
ncbi:AIPR family protein [Acetobacter indonesiensis]|uniref:AIPR family protein n=1 Tax=Acetobacter indonesiensis TaxID=104101 RepID=UPI001F1DE10A|nr:AIPR family protein [Acetobacter indonesiensis]MCG0996405.1 AIPR family protein [Acetobacter indonesiensis]